MGFRCALACLSLADKVGEESGTQGGLRYWVSFGGIGSRIWSIDRACGWSFASVELTISLGFLLSICHALGYCIRDVRSIGGPRNARQFTSLARFPCYDQK